MHATTHWLRDLVSIGSVNPMGRDLAGPHIFEARLTDYLEAQFRDLGVRYERQPVAPQRENIVAYHEPAGATWTLVLEVHQDTVPTDGMTIDPFAAEIRDGRLYGRGACDVKGGMASMLGAFARWSREARRRPRVVLACTVDEEFTFLGVQRLVRDDLGREGGPIARRRRGADQPRHRLRAQGRRSLAPPHDGPIAAIVRDPNWASTPSITWRPSSATSSATPPTCGPGRAIHGSGRRRYRSAWSTVVPASTRCPTSATSRSTVARCLVRTTLPSRPT